MLRVGLVGCGFIGTVHSYALWAVRSTGRCDVRLTALLDEDRSRAEDLAAPQGADVAADLDDLIDRVDAVFVCTPTARHLEVVERAAAAGRPVFCEKPLGRTLEEAERVAAALRGVPHQVGLVLRFSPVFAELGRVLAAGDHGRPIAAHLRDDQYFPNQGQYASTWRASAETSGGGTLIEHSIHDVDILRAVLGGPCEVSARTACFFGHADVEDLAAVTFGYPDGRVVSILSVWHQVLTRPSTRRLEVFCEDALLWLDDDAHGPLHIETTNGSEARTTDPPLWVETIDLPADRRRSLGLYAVQAEAFVSAVANGALPGGPSADDAVAAHRLVDAAYRSAASGGASVPVSS